MQIWSRKKYESVSHRVLLFSAASMSLRICKLRIDTSGVYLWTSAGALSVYRNTSSDNCVVVEARGHNRAARIASLCHVESYSFKVYAIVSNTWNIKILRLATSYYLSLANNETQGCKHLKRLNVYHDQFLSLLDQALAVEDRTRLRSLRAHQNIHDWPRSHSEHPQITQCDSLDFSIMTISHGKALKFSQHIEFLALLNEHFVSGNVK